MHQSEKGKRLRKPALVMAGALIVFPFSSCRHHVPAKTARVPLAGAHAGGAAWEKYLAKSNAAMARDRAVLKQEMAHSGRLWADRARDAADFSLPKNMSRAWLGSAEGRRTAACVLSWQTPSGGWSKHVPTSQEMRRPGERWNQGRRWAYVGTIDNGATTGQIKFLAASRQATGDASCREAVLRGLDYLLTAQYPNGGWPQVYPLTGGYQDCVTYNDDAMFHVLDLLQDAARGGGVWSVVDAERRRRCERAATRGVECLLASQVVVNGRRTVWCAQHDALTLAPAPARIYEKVSLSGDESVGVVRFLMSLEKGDPRVAKSVEDACRWFQETALHGIRFEKGPGGARLIPDATAPPLWARFYEIGSNRPIFCGTNGQVKYELAAIDEERRNGYTWYNDRASKLLNVDLPAWRARRTQTGRPLL